MFWRTTVQLFITLVLYLELSAATPPVGVPMQSANYINQQQQQGSPPPEAHNVQADHPVHPGAQWNHRRETEEEKKTAPTRRGSTPGTSPLTSPEHEYYVPEENPGSITFGDFDSTQMDTGTSTAALEGDKLDPTSEEFWAKARPHPVPQVSDFVPTLIIRGEAHQNSHPNPTLEPYLGLAFRAECTGQPRNMGKLTAFKNCKWFQRLHIRYLEWFRYAPTISLIQDIGKDLLHPFTVQITAPFYFGRPSTRVYSILQAMVYDFVSYLGHSPLLEQVAAIADPDILLQLFGDIYRDSLQHSDSEAARRVRDYFGTGKFLHGLQEAIRGRMRTHRPTINALKNTRRSMIFLYHGMDHPLTKTLSVPTHDVHVLQGREFGDFHAWYGYLLMDRRELLLHEDYYQRQTPRNVSPEDNVIGRNMVPVIPPFKEPLETFMDPPTVMPPLLGDDDPKE